MELNGTPDTYIAGMMDAARIVRERKGKYTLEQTANYLEALCTSQDIVDDPPTAILRLEVIRKAWAETDLSFKAKVCDQYPELHNALKG